MSYVACTKSEYNCDVIINMFLWFSDLNSKKGYMVFKNYSIKLQFFPDKCTFKAIFRFKKSLHTVFFLIYKDVIKASQNIYHSTDRQTDVASTASYLIWDKTFCIK